MAVDRKPNKHSASEDEMGMVHNLTTKLYLKSLQAMIQKVSDGHDIEAVIGDGKILTSAGKWAADMNSITTSAPEMDETTELNKELARIKAAQIANMNTEKEHRATGTTGMGNVVKFDDTREEF